MKKIKFYITDVFATNKYEGNQLAVFIDLENQVSEDEMQKIAREINFAETTFIKEDKGDQRYAVRIFTPEHEIPFAGHPAIGTSYIIAKFLLPQVKQKLVLALIQSDIEISILEPGNIDESIFYMLQAQPEFRETFSHEEISSELEISRDSLDVSQPVREISTGLPYIIIPLKSLAAIENIRLQYSSFKNFLQARRKYKTNSSTGHSTSLFFFTSETYEANNYNTRMFLIENDKLSEDAATGSANGCFLAYLLKYNSHRINASVEQGFQMNRRSYLYLDGEFDGEKYRIRVGGGTKLISDGTWYL